MRQQVWCSVTGCNEPARFLLNRYSGTFSELRENEIPLPPELVAICSAHLETFTRWEPIQRNRGA